MLSLSSWYIIIIFIIIIIIILLLFMLFQAQRRPRPQPSSPGLLAFSPLPRGPPARPAALPPQIQPPSRVAHEAYLACFCTVPRARPACLSPQLMRPAACLLLCVPHGPRQHVLPPFFLACGGSARSACLTLLHLAWAPPHLAWLCISSDLLCHFFLPRKVT